MLRFEKMPQSKKCTKSEDERHKQKSLVCSAFYILQLAFRKRLGVAFKHKKTELWKIAKKNIVWNHP